MGQPKRRILGVKGDQLEKLWQVADDRQDAPPSGDAGSAPSGSYSPKTHTSIPELTEGPGTTVGPYKLLQQIGEGGFGAVYMAEQKHPVKRRVALKIIKIGMDTKQVIGRFEAERQALAMMDHPNIAKVLDAGATERGRPYFVMELVKGIPMTKYCDDNQLSTEIRLKLFVDVCRAIRHAHQKGIIHRDIKPSNIMITLHDGVPVPKVIDFGIAKATQQELTEKTLFTHYGQFIGTPTYMSPEQAEMSGLDIDTRSDIYSLGILLYELLTGKTPLDAEALRDAGYDEIRRRIREEEPSRPSTRVSTMVDEELTTISRQRQTEPSKFKHLLRGDLDWIVMKCLEKDRTRRYETVNGLALDIQHHLDHEPVTAVAPSPIYKLSKFARRNKLAVGAGAAIFLALLVGLGVSLNFYRRERAAHATSEQRRLEAETAENAAIAAKQEAERQASRAEESEFATRQTSYVAEMIVAQQALSTGNTDRVIALLNRHVPQPGEPDLRGFEWRYLWGQAHRELWSIQSETDPIHSLAISPDGKLMASADRFGMVRLWDMKTRHEVFQISTGGRLWAWVDFSPHGDLLAIGSNLGHILIWDVNARVERARIETPTRGYARARFSPDGRVVAIGASDGTLRLHHLDAGKNTDIKAHDAELTSISFSADGRTLVTAGQNGTVKVWDTPEYSPRHTLKADGPPTVRAELSANGKWIAAVPMFGVTATIWDAESGEKLIELPHPVHMPCLSLQFSPDSQILGVSVMSGPIALYATHNWEEITTYHHRGHFVNSIAFSPAEAVLLSAGDRGTITAWDAQPRPNQGLLKTHPWGITTLSYSPDGRYLAVGSGEGSVTLWDADSDTRLFQTPSSVTLRGPIPGHQFRSDFFAFHPDRQRIAVSTSEQDLHAVCEWDIRSREIVRRFPHEGRVMSLAYSPDGRHLATGAGQWPGVIRFWNLANGQPVGPTIDGGPSIVSMAYSPNGRLLATESEGGLAKGFSVWDVTTGKLTRNLRGHSGPVGANQSLAFSPDGSLLATAGYDKVVILWDTETWQPVRSLLGHMAKVHDLAFSPDGTRLASTSLDGLTRLWHMETGREIGSFVGQAVDFSPDGHTLAIGGKSGFPFGQSQESTSVRLHRAPSLSDIESAEALLRQRRQRVDPGAVTRWLLLGPLKIAEGDSPASQHLDREAHLNPVADEQVLMSDVELSWRPIQQESYQLDFEKILGNHAQAAVIAVCSVESEQTLQNLNILVGSDDRSILYLNGVEVHRNAENRSFQRDQDRVRGMQLKRGRNRLVFKVINHAGSWAGSVRFTDEKGYPLEGIRVTLSPEDD